MTITRRAKCAMIPAMSRSKGAELRRELPHNAAPASWEPSGSDTLWLMSNMVLLPDIDCPAVVLAIVWMVTKRLEPTAELRALFYHDVGV